MHPQNIYDKSDKSSVSSILIWNVPAEGNLCINEKLSIFLLSIYNVLFASLINEYNSKFSLSVLSILKPNKLTRLFPFGSSIVISNSI